jgi:hypothetical protein
MLAWALWLAAGLVRAVGWGWRAFGEGGLWRKLSLPRSRVVPGRAGAGPGTPAPPTPPAQG